jgi:hypothetical protein
MFYRVAYQEATVAVGYFKKINSSYLFVVGLGYGKQVTFLAKRAALSSPQFSSPNSSPHFSLIISIYLNIRLTTKWSEG